MKEYTREQVIELAYEAIQEAADLKNDYFMFVVAQKDGENTAHVVCNMDNTNISKAMLLYMVKNPDFLEEFLCLLGELGEAVQEEQNKRLN